MLGCGSSAYSTGVLKVCCCQMAFDVVVKVSVVTLFPLCVVACWNGGCCRFTNCRFANISCRCECFLAVVVVLDLHDCCRVACVSFVVVSIGCGFAYS